MPSGADADSVLNALTGPDRLRPSNVQKYVTLFRLAQERERREDVGGSLPRRGRNGHAAGGLQVLSVTQRLT